MREPIGRPRWWAKKAARHAVAAASVAAVALPNRRAWGVRVLTYHRFGHAVRDPFCITPRAFDAQMAWLAREGLAVRLADVEAFVRGERRLPRGAVLVTIDDGSRSTYTEARPVLETHHIPAVAFVVAGGVGRRQGPGGEPYLTWRELARLAGAGITIGSHAFRHRSLGRLPLGAVREEAERSKRALEAHLGLPVTTFAYPFGTRADHSDATARVLAESGYTTAFTAQHGAVAAGADPLALPRIKVEAGEGRWMFRQLTRGSLDAWRLVDRHLWRLQRPRPSTPT